MKSTIGQKISHTYTQPQMASNSPPPSWIQSSALPPTTWMSPTLSVVTSRYADDAQAHNFWIFGAHFKPSIFPFFLFQPLTLNFLQLIDITDDGFVSLLTDDGSTKDDLVVPSGDIGEEVKAAFAEYVYHPKYFLFPFPRHFLTNLLSHLQR